MEEMSEEDFIKLYELYCKLHPGREFENNIWLVVENGKLVSPNSNITKGTIGRFIHHVIKTAPVMDDILKLINY